VSRRGTRTNDCVDESIIGGDESRGVPGNEGLGTPDPARLTIRRGPDLALLTKPERAGKGHRIDSLRRAEPWQK
jgi:hypothetical protein